MSLLSKPLAGLVVVLLLVVGSFPSSSSARQADTGTDCVDNYNNPILVGDCPDDVDYCDYNNFIAARCRTLEVYCGYNDFLSGKCPYFFWVMESTRPPRTQQAFAGLGLRPVTGDAAVADSNAAEDGVVATSTAELAITGSDDRTPLAGLLLLSVGSFAIAISRSRRPV